MTSQHASTEAVPRLARIIPRDSHPISRSKISNDALRVLYRLREAGFEAFLVGGCVRDLSLGLEPKDFDVATNALPEQVKRLFRNCRLVGRRFRLAHVFFGREIIEVATFRASGAPPQGEEVVEPVDAGEGDEFEAAGEESVVLPEEVEDSRDVHDFDESLERVVDESGRILRDNVYGSIDDDVWRRDFTCNALYYNIADFSVWDYTEGFEDIKARRLRLIGDPETRYREDPVRMLRAARFEAKLGFTIEAATAEPIARLRELLAGVPPARLFDETLKLFLTGHGAASYRVLLERGLLDVLLPSVAAFARRHPGSAPERMLIQGLVNTDARVREDRPVTPSFLFALLLYGPIGLAIEKQPRAEWHEVSVILDVVDSVFREIYQRVSVHRRFILAVRDIFALQPRLEVPRGRRALRTLEHPRFRAAFDLLQLRAEFGMADQALVGWWSRLQAAKPDQQASMAEALGRLGGGAATGGSGAAGGSGPGGRRRSGRRRGGRSRGGRGRGGGGSGAG
ncbi:MAG: polynucleotide adenylyltransferase PcnB [Gammaproteobacteria bacterium]|nr:polynucleotide adenylyltransferase PcnB [Gammaproteobacteria bacterium]